ncbi:class I adenylate-forming enzyme family protein [Candidatus Amarolinea aalborgensis]|uniref:class I adenylate-forming enzyme family protein n=1 Tax=Candidatus Amarolinea aalborgensis TaxID=2249329 RepID=UPI003BF9B083
MEIEKRHGVPQMTLGHYETDFADRHLLHGIVAKWARAKPKALALINADTKQEITWEQFDKTTTALAMKLVAMGFKKGDFFATSLPFLTEHIFLQYACFKIGVIHAPLDLRLKGPEVIRSLSLIKAKGYAFLGQTPLADFRELGKAVMAHCPFVEHFIQFSAPDETIAGAKSAFVLAAEAQALATAAVQDPANSPTLRAFGAAAAAVAETDGAQVIFTTGSTGYPKPALLSHRNITCQNMCLAYGFGIGEDSRMLVNLPPSHVGGQAEQLMTVLWMGGTAVILHIFDPVKSLQAIQDYRVTVMGQIPALFNMEWRLPNYDQYDLSSLEFALYGGQQVPRSFLERLKAMAPKFGTGLGLTETGGFVTYSPLDGTVDDILASVGFDMPAYPLSIRQPLQADGAAGAELPDGEIGDICFSGPQTFLGYVNNPEATAHTISTDGIIYTGDIGFKDDAGLHFTARTRWVIKPKGYQVYPAQVEDYLCELREKVAAAAVVGVEHDVFVEAIVAFVEKKPGIELTPADLEAHGRGLTAYMRPLHYVILEPGQLPLNRVAKTDYVTLSALAKETIAALRAQGGWDR